MLLVLKRGQNAFAKHSKLGERLYMGALIFLQCDEIKIIFIKELPRI